MRARSKRCLQVLSVVAVSTLPEVMCSATSTWTYGPNGGSWTASWNDVTTVKPWSPNDSYPNSTTALVIFPAVYGAGNTPVITSGPGNVVLNGTGVSANQINFYGSGANSIANPQVVGGYTLSGTGSLTLSPNPGTNDATISVAAVGNSNLVFLPGIATISTSIRMTSGALFKEGSGTLVLNGSNSLINQGLQIDGGTVRVTNTNSLSGLSQIATTNDGQIEIQNTSGADTVFSLLGSSTLRPEGVLYNSAGDNTWSGLVLLAENGQSIGTAPQTSLTLAGGLLDLTNGTASLIKVGGGTLASGTLAMNHALIINGGTMKTVAGGTAPSDIQSMTIAGGAAPSAKLDLTNNSAVIRSADQAALAADLAAGFAGGAWSGNGISSSTAQADAAAHGGRTVTGIGMLKAEELPDWNGTQSHFRSVTLTAGNVALMYTHSGDTNLNGIVDLNDFTNYLVGLTGTAPAGLIAPDAITNGSDWSNGDLNYDGIVDINSDFPLFVAGYDSSGSSLDALRNSINNAQDLTSSQKLTILQIVPEPDCMGIAILTTMTALARRRRVARLAAP